jgi:O-antigen ligase
MADKKAAPPITRPDHTTAAGQVGRILRIAAGLGFAGLLVFAPLNFGSTRSGGPEVITLGCTVATLLWSASFVFTGRHPQVPATAALAIALFVVATLPWSTGLYHATPVSPFTQAHFARIAARWPFSIVWRDATNALPLAVALAAAALPLIDLARTPGWALTFSLALVVTAVAVAGLALAQNYTHATGIYWRDDGRMPGNFCGTFFHHTSAGAYFNTAWPLALALTWLAWDRPDPTQLTKTLAALGGLGSVLLLAAHGSHVSRLPQVTALLVAPFLLAGLKLRGGWRRPLLILGGVVLVILLVATMGRTDAIAARWRLIFISTPATHVPAPPESAWPALMRDDLFIPGTSSGGLLGDRGEGWRTALRSIAARPFTGHGPANWMGAASQHSTDPFVRTFFQFLQFTHQDVLQSAVEWGVPAALGWWILLAGGVVAVFRARRRISGTPRRLGIAAACALAAVLLQSQVDFPLQIPAVTLNAVVLAALCWAGSGCVHPESPAAS